MEYVNKRGGGSTKYINQNDDNFIISYRDSLFSTYYL